MLGTIQDITERKRTELALQKAYDELGQRAEEALRRATSGTNWPSAELVLASGTGIFARASCTTRPVGRPSSAMTRMRLGKPSRITPA